VYREPAGLVYRAGDRVNYPAAEGLARPGGPWLCSTLVLSLFHAVVVPSALTTKVQPRLWIMT
jgi:hypothetical protein